MFFEQPSELNRAVNALRAQRELLMRQVQEGSISQAEGQKEQQRLATLIGAYTQNMLTANEQQAAHRSFSR